MLFFILYIEKYLRHEFAKEIGMRIFLVTRREEKLKSLKVLFLQKYLRDLFAKFFVLKQLLLIFRQIRQLSVGRMQ